MSQEIVVKNDNSITVIKTAIFFVLVIVVIYFLLTKAKWLKDALSNFQFSSPGNLFANFGSGFGFGNGAKTGDLSGDTSQSTAPANGTQSQQTNTGASGNSSQNYLGYNNGTIPVVNVTPNGNYTTYESATVWDNYYSEEQQ